MTMKVPLPPSLFPQMSPALGVRLTQNAYARITTYCQMNGISQSELLRGLIKTGWAAHFDNQNIDMPLGTNVPLQQETAA